MHSDLTLMFACVLTDSLSAQRVHTHGRRVRHSSSDSSGSDRSVDSGSSSLHSRSPSQSPEVPPDPLLPANVQPACSSNKEVSARLERSSVSTSFAQVCEFFMGSGGLRAADGRYVCVCVGGTEECSGEWTMVVGGGVAGVMGPDVVSAIPGQQKNTAGLKS